jgi:hypothetical protein
MTGTFSLALRTVSPFTTVEGIFKWRCCRSLPVSGSSWYYQSSDLTSAFHSCWKAEVLFNKYQIELAVSAACGVWMNESQNVIFSPA